MRPKNIVIYFSSNDENKLRMEKYFSFKDKEKREVEEY